MINYDFSQNITQPDDFTNATGINLYNELVSRVNNDVDENNDDAFVRRFIKEIEDWCKDYLTENYDFNGVVNVDNPFIKQRFVKGVVCQIEYVLESGSIDNLSGLKDGNYIVPREVLNKLALSPNAKRSFWLGGMANIKRY